MPKKEILNDNAGVTANSHQIEILKQNFPQCFDKDGNFIMHKMEEVVGESGLELSKESYSLNWLGKSYARLLANENPRTLLKEDKEHNAKEQNNHSQNILIKGDNLEVLKHLSNAYAEAIKMIYIDPPYNTGSDGFVYHDDRKFRPDELSRLAGIDIDEAKRILEFTQSNANSHSAWLTFMYPRLYVARHLLREDGVIFISIDGNEQAQLKLLCDEIFGEENFRGEIVRATGTTTGQEALKIGSSYDSCLCYAKSDQFELKGIPLKGKDLNRFNNDDNDGKGKYALLQLRKTGNADRKEDREGMFFPIEAPDGSLVFPIGPTGYLSRWRTGKKKFQTFLDEGLIVWKQNGDDIDEFDDYEEEDDDISNYTEITNENADISKYKSNWKPYVKYYLSDRTKKVSNLWTDIDGNKKGSIELKELFNNKKIFENPKPIDFINRVITISCNNNDLILDFFAGSGTTGDAVMQLNVEDEGSRKYILVQLPEPIDPKKNKNAYEFVKNELGVEEPTIFEITKERLIRAAKKIKEDFENDQKNKNEELTKLEKKDKKTKKDQEKIEKLKEELNKLNQKIENIKKEDLGFKIYETIPVWDGYLDEIEKLTDDTTLFDGSKLSDEELEVLLTTWKVHDGMPLTQELEQVVLASYQGYLGEGILYLVESGFDTDALKALLEKLDSDEQFEPSRVVMFGYNFSSKAQRELSEALESYANKKSIELDLVVRY